MFEDGRSGWVCWVVGIVLGWVILFGVFCYLISLFVFGVDIGWFVVLLWVVCSFLIGDVGDLLLVVDDVYNLDLLLVILVY